MAPSRSRMMAAAAALLILLCLGGVAGGVAIAGSEPAAELERTLLTAEDLPADLVPGGVTHDPEFDIDEASYVAAGGLDRVMQLWQTAEV